MGICGASLMFELCCLFKLMNILDIWKAQYGLYITDQKSHYITVLICEIISANCYFFFWSFCAQRYVVIFWPNWIKARRSKNANWCIVLLTYLFVEMQLYFDNIPMYMYNVSRCAWWFYFHLLSFVSDVHTTYRYCIIGLIGWMQPVRSKWSNLSRVTLERGGADWSGAGLGWVGFEGDLKVIMMWRLWKCQYMMLVPMCHSSWLTGDSGYAYENIHGPKTRSFHNFSYCSAVVAFVL